MNYFNFLPPTVRVALSVTYELPSVAVQIYVPESETTALIITNTPSPSSVVRSRGRTPPSFDQWILTGP